MVVPLFVPLPPKGNIDQGDPQLFSLLFFHLVFILVIKLRSKKIKNKNRTKNRNKKDNESFNEKDILRVCVDRRRCGSNDEDPTRYG